MKLLATCVITVLALSSTAQPYLADKVIAVVGDKIVLMSDVELQFVSYRQQGIMIENLRCDILDNLMGQKLLIAQAELDSVTAEETEVERELSRRIDYFVSLLGSKERLEEYYGMSIQEMKEQFRPDVREQLVAQKMQGIITADVSITPREVRRYFEEIPKDSLPYFPARFQVGQLVIKPTVTELQKDIALELANDVRSKILSGRSFCSMTALYSDDVSTKSNCGELPEFGKNDGYVREFVAAAFKLQDGETSEIIETQFGYHIIEMMKRSGERVKVRHILIRPKITSLDIEEAVTKLDSIRTQIVEGKMTFAQAVNVFADDEMTKQTNGILTNPSSGDQWFEMTSLKDYDAELPFIVEKLEVGELSQVRPYKDARGDDAVRVVFLKAEQPPHLASLDVDYSRIQEEALTMKKLEATQAWLDEKIRKTFISIDESFADCTVLEAWHR